MTRAEVAQCIDVAPGLLGIGSGAEESSDTVDDYSISLSSSGMNCSLMLSMSSGNVLFVNQLWPEDNPPSGVEQCEAIVASCFSG